MLKKGKRKCLLSDGIESINLRFLAVKKPRAEDHARRPTFRILIDDSFFPWFLVQNVTKLRQKYDVKNVVAKKRSISCLEIVWLEQLDISIRLGVL